MALKQIRGSQVPSQAVRQLIFGNIKSEEMPILWSQVSCTITLFDTLGRPQNYVGSHLGHCSTFQMVGARSFVGLENACIKCRVSDGSDTPGTMYMSHTSVSIIIINLRNSMQ